mgnify:CR=1 FL=1
MSSIKRLTRELKRWKENPVKGISMELPDPDNLMLWHVTFEMPDGCAYEGETHRVQFVMDKDYPYEAPTVAFLTDVDNEHVYSNGHICLSTLYNDWSPSLSIQSASISIFSILVGAKEKGRPHDDKKYTMLCARTGLSSKAVKWEFHDDKC